MLCLGITSLAWVRCCKALVLDCSGSLAVLYGTIMGSGLHYLFPDVPSQNEHLSSAPLWPHGTLAQPVCLYFLCCLPAQTAYEITGFQEGLGNVSNWSFKEKCMYLSGAPGAAWKTFWCAALHPKACADPAHVQGCAWAPGLLGSALLAAAGGQPA